MEINQERDIRIRTTILFEYYNRLYGKSENPEIHFYNFPELKDIDNDIISANAIYLIDENFVRGGVDVAGVHSFPWITRINSTGMKLVESLVLKSEEKIPELKEELKDKSSTQDRVIAFISYCVKHKDIPLTVIDIARDFFI